MAKHGDSAFTLATGALAYTVLVLLWWLVLEPAYWPLWLSAAGGVVLTAVIWMALHARCSTAPGWADPVAAAGVLAMGSLGLLGFAFGGLFVLPAAAALAMAHVLTPRAR